MGAAETREARISGQWSRALRRLVQRRQAVRTAAPFTAAVVAVAESWLYSGGVLCHILDRTLRVLDLHRSQSAETVIDIRSLLHATLPQPRGRRRYKFDLLHYAEGLVSCLYSRSRPHPGSFLVVLDVSSRRLVTTRPLESTYKLFVRNDANFLYFGTHSEIGDDGFRRWALTRYDTAENQWAKNEIHLIDFAGSDIGQSICFEIIDGYFYGISNQNSFEVNEVDWTSYYHCFRFPVDQPRQEVTDRAEKKLMWRRQHADGPVDDRWSFCRLVKNEETGHMQILESRKEWLDRRSSGQRAYYTTDIAWKSKKDDSDGNDADTAAGAGAGTSTDSSNNATGGGSSGSSSSSRNTSDDIFLNPSHSTTHTTPARWDSLTIPAKTETQLRNPHKTHMGDDASARVMIKLSKCHIRSYHYESQAFLDLVDNPHPEDLGSKARLQLRSGSRQLVPAEQLGPDSPGYDKTLPHTTRIKHLYKNDGANTITLWPPAPEEGEQVGADADALEQLGKIMNPPSHAGNAKGVWDERSFVYSVGSNADGVQAIIFVGFDPSLKLEGLQKWGRGRTGTVETHGLGDKNMEGKKEAPTMESARVEYAEREDEAAAATGEELFGEDMMTEEVFADDWLAEEDTGLDQELAVTCEGAAPDGDSPRSSGYSSGEDDTSCPCSSTDDPQPRIAGGGQASGAANHAWAQVQAAMYRQISFGYYGLPDFAEEKKILAAAAKQKRV